MGFLDKIRLIPTIIRAARKARKQGMTSEEMMSSTLRSAVHKAATNDGQDEETAARYVRLLDEGVSIDGIAAPDDCISIWKKLDSYEEDDRLNSEGLEWTGLHLKMIRALRLEWDDMESGAPAISPERPYGSANLFADLETLSGQTDKAELARLHAQIYSAIRVFLALGRLPEGDTTVTTEQLTALKALVWSWPGSDDIEEELAFGNWPTPKTDPKRPYGDFSFYQLELADALGWKMVKDDDGNYQLSAEQDEKLIKIHGSLFRVIRVFFEKAELSPGTYKI